MVRRKRAIPDGDPELGRTTRGENFVSLEEDGILIVTTLENLNFLRENRRWFCDLTFDSAPATQQLYTVHAVLYGTHTLPLLYCITQNRSEETYRSKM